MLRVTDLILPYSATWAPLEAYRLLLLHTIDTHVELVYNRMDYFEIVNNVSMLSSPEYIKGLA